MNKFHLKVSEYISKTTDSLTMSSQVNKRSYAKRIIESEGQTDG
jgi:hypothetical protein